MANREVELFIKDFLKEIREDAVRSGG